MSKKELKALAIIEKHKGKKKVYEDLLVTNPERAEKYLDFISRNKDAQYIKWDDIKSKFIYN